MALYRNDLPPLKGEQCLADAGLETVLIFHEGIELPDFAAFVLLKDKKGADAVRDYFSTYAKLAAEYDLGCILETATWRASPDWAKALNYSESELEAAIKAAVQILADVRAEQPEGSKPLIISGCVGPRGDGYVAGELMTAEDAEAYHAVQIGHFKDTEADLITGLTMTYPDEAIGIARAAQKAGMPSVISFTVETDGRLPTGDTLEAAISAVDAATESSPAYYMINCAHPTHFQSVLETSSGWAERIMGVRPNASALSHAELDEAEELDDGNPPELGAQVHAMRAMLPNLVVVGGCCGTDHRHIEAMAKAFRA